MRLEKRRARCLTCVDPLVPLTISLTGNNIGVRSGSSARALTGQGSTKRACGMGLINSIGNAGGIISSFIYRAQDKPRYTIGHGTVLGFIACVPGALLDLTEQHEHDPDRAADTLLSESREDAER